MGKIDDLRAIRFEILTTIQDVEDFHRFCSQDQPSSVKESMATLRIRLEEQLSQCNLLIREEEVERLERRRHNVQ